jgi:uncharacterized protein (DUF3820 family)
MPGAAAAASLKPPTHVVSDASASSIEEYRFDFGKHSGKNLGEVPQDYLKFLKERGILTERPILASTIADYERRHLPEANYRLTFGKNEGKSLFEVPADYIDFLNDNGVTQRYPDLAAAMRHLNAVTAQTRASVNKSKSKSKKRKQPVESSSANSS